MTAIVFPTSSSPGIRPQESAGRLVNAFVEKTEAGAPGATLWRRSGGLLYAGSGPTPHTRGFQAYRDSDELTAGARSWATAFWVVNDNLLLLQLDPGTGNYSVTIVGALPGEEAVTMGRNNAVVREVVAVTEEGSFVLTAGLPVPYVTVDTSLPPFPTSVCGMDGYFVWSFQNGKIYASELNSTAVEALSFNTEQGQAVLRVVAFAGRLYAFGDKWTGVYRNAGTVPFPFLREATVPRGIIGTHAVAGWEAGWANELIWAADDHIVYKLNGYTPVPISSDAVSRDIQNAVLNGCVLEAFVYMLGKNAFWVLNASHPFKPEFRWTWEYNATTGQWNERESKSLTNWRGHKSIRGTKDWLIGDQFAPTLFRVRDGYFAEERVPETPDSVLWTVESGVMSGFPLRMVIPRASFNITAGVGRAEAIPADPTPVPDPKVRIYWSLDGGYTWSLPLERALGGPGETRFNPSVINSGLSKGQGVRYRLEVEDNVYVGLSGGEIDVQPRAP